MEANCSHLCLPAEPGCPGDTVCSLCGESHVPGRAAVKGQMRWEQNKNKKINPQSITSSSPIPSCKTMPVPLSSISVTFSSFALYVDGDF